MTITSASVVSTGEEILPVGVPSAHRGDLSVLAAGAALQPRPSVWRFDSWIELARLVVHLSERVGPRAGGRCRLVGGLKALFFCSSILQRFP